MKILAIESSCDETAVAVVENGQKICSNQIFSQIKTHRAYGGVVPELASRLHAEVIHELITKTLEESQLEFKDLEACAVTYGPGLEGALLVGLSCAKTIASSLKIPLIPVNHLHGHIYAHFLEGTGPNFPFVILIASGGHTQLVLAKDHFKFSIIGETRDDAAGEAFDKVARVLGLGYPGGPAVEKAAKSGKENAFQFPRAMKQSPFEFSFSGLKTAVIQTVQKLDPQSLPIEDLCASFQAAVIDTLVSKSIRACKTHQIATLLVSGGVMANQSLLAAFREAAKQEKIELRSVSPILCTDNAAMIGSAAFYQLQTNYPSPPALATPNAKL